MVVLLGVLDAVTVTAFEFLCVCPVFGFECFAVNSLEQLAINFANESLQKLFNSYVFERQTEEYKREGIPWKDIPFPSNQQVLDLIVARRPPGGASPSFPPALLVAVVDMNDPWSPSTSSYVLTPSVPFIVQCLRCWTKSACCRGAPTTRCAAS